LPSSREGGRNFCVGRTLMSDKSQTSENLHLSQTAGRSC